MSRSKRSPVWVEGYGNKEKPQRKRRANRVVRLEEDEDIKSGSHYKKLSNSWDITDYKFYDPNNKKVGRK